MTWDVLLTRDNFRLAWRRIRNSSKTTTKDRLGLNIFSQALDIHIDRLIRDLETKHYEPNIPSLIYLPKKSGRLRPFPLLHMRDRIVYQAIGNVLIQNAYEDLKINADINVFSPVLAGVEQDYVFYPSLRKGDEFEGQFLKFTKKQTEFINSGKFTWVVEADIASFYPSIDHSLLMQKLVKNGWLDQQLCEFLQRCLRIWTSDRVETQVNKGLPIGYETSDLLASLFLNDLDQFLVDQSYVRYVDDIRIYTTSLNEGAKLLNHLDVFLQRQGLILQDAKSAIKDLTEFYTEDWLQNLVEQQILLSSIDEDINSPNQSIQEETNKKLRKLLVGVLGIQDRVGLNLDEKIEPAEETSLFFALYRIREKHNDLKNIALDLLNAYPHRSYAILQYLTLFQDDIVVIERLWSIVEDESKHGQVRANSLRALYKLTDEAEKIKDTITVWLYSTDLSLSLCAIELMQQYPESVASFKLETVANSQIDQHLLYSIISTRFILLNSDDEKLKLISWCLDKDDYMLNTLGVYFLSTNVGLQPVVVGDVSNLAQELMEDLKNRVSFEGIIQNILNLFDTQYTFNLRKEVLFALSNLNQFVINMMLARETNRDEYLRNLADFLIEFSQLYQSITSKEFKSLIQTPEIQKAFEYTQNGLANLSDFRSSITFLGTRPALGHIDVERLHNGISEVVFNALIEIELLTKDTLEVTAQEIIDSTSVSLPVIFFSYSHEDKRERNTLEKKLRYLETQALAKLWSDRKIPAGQVWDEELNEKLNEAVIVLFLITSNFMGSKFINQEEMPRAIENYNNEKTVCIPILLEDCDWDDFYPYRHLQAVPIDEEERGVKAVTQWTRPDSAYKDIQKKVRTTLEEIKNGTHKWRRVPPKS